MIISKYLVHFKSSLNYNIMKNLTLILTVTFLCIATSNGKRNFFMGRRSGGFLLPPPPQFTAKETELQWFDQKLDHFTPTDTTTWRQKYYVNDEFFEAKDAPVFIMLGGEGPASDSWMKYGAWYDSARRYGALLLQLEHRFYGDSQPTRNWSVSNLRYLSSEQALADTASFIASINTSYNLTSSNKWIAFGGSYSGALAAWLRLKYPHLVLGASSASGPVLAQLDFFNYFRVVGESLATYVDGAVCVQAIHDAFTDIQEILNAQDTQGMLTVDDLFHTCTPITSSIDNEKDIATLLLELADTFAGVVQYNLLRTPGINDVCGLMVDESLGSPMERLAVVAKSPFCLDFSYEDLLANYKDEELSSFDSSRQWMWQTCTEFGYYQTSTYETHVFGDRFPVKYYEELCADIFGDVFTDKLLNGVVRATNEDYGGLQINATNVVYVHGSIDPWHALGILETVDESAPARMIQGTAHCANMYSQASSDSEELIAARDWVQGIIGQWLGLD